jgi:hypothetical protein
MKFLITVRGRIKVVSLVKATRCPHRLATQSFNSRGYGMRYGCSSSLWLRYGTPGCHNPRLPLGRLGLHLAGRFQVLLRARQVLQRSPRLRQCGCCQGCVCSWRQGCVAQARNRHRHYGEFRGVAVSIMFLLCSF